MTVRLQSISYDELLKLKLPPRKNLLSPWLAKQSLNMVHAWRGVGKTNFCMSIATAIACGGNFLSYKAEQPAGVLYIDGELPACVLQDRLSKALAVATRKPVAPLGFVNAELQDGIMPDIATSEGRGKIEELIWVMGLIDDHYELVILDNVSSLIASGDENSTEAWAPIQAWLIKLRRQGKSVLLVHHSGKNGLQRGCSGREDVMDTVIKLDRPSGHVPQDGCAFTINFEKARGMYGADIAPMTARLETDQTGRPIWTTDRNDLVIQYYQQGMKQADIARELGLHKSSISRRLKDYENQLS